MHHWRKAMKKRETQHAHEAKLRLDPHSNARYNKNVATRSEKSANFHIAACQALNDVLPGTAEQDCDKEDQLNLLLKGSK